MRVDLVFCNNCYLLWPILYTICQSFIVPNGQNWKDQLSICSHCSACFFLLKHWWAWEWSSFQSSYVRSLAGLLLDEAANERTKFWMNLTRSLFCVHSVCVEEGGGFLGGQWTLPFASADKVQATSTSSSTSTTTTTWSEDGFVQKTWSSSD